MGELPIDELNLGERLRTVADMLPACDTFYDIGTDHGKLPAYLLKTQKCRRAVLTDNAERPLNRARRLFRREKLKATFIQTDGLAGISPNTGDALAICGMGAHVMLGILERSLPCHGVLQPSARIEVLRKGLPKADIAIINERLARQGGRFYVCLYVEPGSAKEVSDREAYIGNLRGDPLYAEYIAWRHSVLVKALSKGSPSPELRTALMWVEEALQE